ncbi:MAG: asparagine synthetase B family protein [Gaiellaceae bacterium]
MEGWVASLGAGALRVFGGPSVQRAKSKDVEVVFDGRLANRRELAQSNATEDVTDAHIVLGAYRRHGERLLPRLRGAFALVIRDGREDLTLCARDPLGVHPLFTGTIGSEPVASASVEALLAHGVSGAVDPVALGDHLLHRWPDPAETPFAAVRRVPPGHAVRVSDGERRTWRYWDPLPAGHDPLWVTEAELDAFDDLLERAVTAQIDGDGVGIFLSGGLDSVSVAAIAAVNARERGAPAPYALSLVFPEPDVDESKLQSSVARGLELPHVLLSWEDAVGADGVVQEALDLSARLAAPLINLWAPAYDRLAAEGARRGCSVVLTGGGGDEWLGVSPLYAADLIRAGDVAGLYRLIAAQGRSHQVDRVRFLWNALWRFGARPLVGDVLARTAPAALSARHRRQAIASIPKWLAPEASLRRALVDRGTASRADATGGGHRFYLNAVRRSLDHALVSVEMEEAFAQGGRTGVSIRAPYWDADLLEFLCRTPPELLNRGGRAKGLVREAVARRFPALGFERQRKVNSMRFAMSLFASELPRAWSALGGPRALAEAGIVDVRALHFSPSGVLTDVDQRLSMQTLWDILNLEVWLRSHH